MRRLLSLVLLVLLVLLALLLGCRRSETRPDPVTIAPEPSKADASVTPADAGADADAAVLAPHVVALPSCTPSPRVAWTKSPFAGIKCSPTRTALAPSTITVAAGTPVRLHLRAEDTIKKGAFHGTG
ncbi:MAG: hypothetical protein ABI175_24210, partial [Polyangiales bacterium]